MHIVMVHIQVKPEFLAPFIAATLDNARSSNQEPGVARFDFMQHADDPTRFCLYEVYYTKAAVDAHRETAHYLRWRETAGAMMEGERIRTEYKPLHPADDAPADAW